ncbi:MAG TPA: dienelactone hydrolase family protein [Puia sp.]|jgi:dienelactone hydrolase|nr:dienelactone hydrolase family protein [Puia sp.]
MIHTKNLFVAVALVAVAFLSCNSGGTKNEDQPPTAAGASVLKEEPVSIQADSTTLNCILAYDDSIRTRRPAVLVIPEWWGLVDYPKMRAKELAKMGYVALALDIFGNGKIAQDPKEAQALTAPFYMHPEKAKARIDAAIAQLKTYPQVDTNNIGAIGYCFGGGVLLNTVRLGDELKAVVSFHGSLLGTPARKDLLKTKILVCHGNSDSFTNSQVPEFKKQMDSIGADYKFIGYDNATHAFTNPASDENAKKFNMPIAYNARADSASWNAMKDFFKKNLK